MKILLIAPPQLTVKGAKFEEVRTFYPLGLMYILGYMRSKGYNDITILDCLAENYLNCSDFKGRIVAYGLSEIEIAERIRKVNPDIVGISCLSTFQLDSALNVARIVKEVTKNALVVLGGNGPTISPEYCLNSGYVDLVVCGEGEITFYEIVDAYDKKMDLTSVTGVYYKKNGQAIFAGKRGLIENLDEIPLPAWDLVNIDQYVKAAYVGAASRRAKVARWATMITSRGCPYDCCFCSVSRLSGRRWRARSPDHVIKELELLVRNYGIGYIFFEDDNFTLDIKRAEMILEKVIERGLKFNWETPNGIRVDRLTPSLVKKMAKSGCRYVAIGIENGDQNFLNSVIGKQLDLRTVEENSQLLIKNGIGVLGFYIFGIPGETKETLNGTRKLIVKLAKRGVIPRIFVAQPYPNTRMFEIAKEKGFLTKNDIATSDYLEHMMLQKSFISTDKFSYKYVENLRKRTLVIAYLTMLVFNPIRTLAMLKYFIRSPVEIISILKQI